MHERAELYEITAGQSLITYFLYPGRGALISLISFFLHFRQLFARGRAVTAVVIYSRVLEMLKISRVINGGSCIWLEAVGSFCQNVRLAPANVVPRVIYARFRDR